MLRCSDGSFYTGITTDVERRVGEHQAQGAQSAKYFRGRTPLEVVYTREFESRSEASREEYRVKQLSRSGKKRLISGETSRQSPGRAE